jgi:hypothetical protein
MKKNEKYLNVAIISLAIHLFFTNSKLLFHMNRDSLTNGNVFDFANLGFEQTMSMIFALSYSVMTVIVIKIIDLPVSKRYNFGMIAYYGLLDGLGVFIYYNAFDNFVFWGSVYYGTYTLSIICSIGLQVVYSREQEKMELDKIEKERTEKAELEKENSEIGELEDTIIDELSTVEKAVNARKQVLRRRKIPFEKDDHLTRLLQIKESYKKPFIPTEKNE